jgi:hypothetical protein
MRHNRGLGPLASRRRRAIHFRSQCNVHHAADLPTVAVMPETSTPKRPWVQFSMFRLMVVVTLVAILLGLATTFGGVLEVMFVSMVWCAFPTPLVICAIYSRRDSQAFAIGALVPWATLVLMRVPPISSQLAGLIWLLVMGGVCGALAVATLRWLQRTGNVP